MSTSNRYAALFSSDEESMPVKMIEEEAERDEKDFGPYLVKRLHALKWRTYNGNLVDKKVLKKEKAEQDEEDFGPFLVKRLRALKWRTFKGNPVDKKVLKKYLTEVVMTEGFDINHYPGYMEGITSIRPYISPNYDEMMELTTTPMKTYNRRHRHSNYKVVEIMKVNIEPGCWASFYYITFKAVHVKKKNVSLQSIIASIWTYLMIVMLTLLVWFGIILPPYSQIVRNWKRILLKLNSAPELKATEYDLREVSESDCTTFQTKVCNNGLHKKREILLCRLSSSSFQSIAPKINLKRSNLEPALKTFKDRLMTKNVAEEIAEQICESVAASLVGKKLDFLTGISSTVQAAMEDALVRILTPRRSVDILRDVHAAKEQGRPYVVVFVGVDGVGKSTNHAKVAYWLSEHKVNVMMAACDTFRSGAVEQLRTHARRLQIPIFEKGYERDPAIVAKEAIQEASRVGSDVVLVDTAGRIQDNEPLMRALSKLIYVNNPDLVLFVGEALVENDGVDQLSKFNQKLRDFSPSPNPRIIDGILLTKFDTIDDKVGAALSMVYISGSPVMFVGCGQSYTDLMKLNVKSIVKTLLQ